jgi:hypothetical protein
MKRIEIHPSVYLAWNIANIEACLSGNPRIEPIHFVLATLIIIDGMFEEVANKMELSPETIREVFDIAAGCRSLLEMTDDEITKARRAIRKALRDPASADEITMLHRSGESRFIFQRAGRRTIEADTVQLTLRHLFEEIVQHMPVDAQPRLRTRSVPQKKELEEWPDYIVDDTRA